MTKIIGITGKARSGKDTLAAALTSGGYERRGFADTLKTLTASLAGEHPDLYFSDVTKEEHCPSLGMTRREALQNVGKGMRDALGPDIWANILVRVWQQDGEPMLVVPDVRYDNEAEILREAGAIIIQVCRPNNVGLTGSAAAHESERGVSGHLVDIFHHNDGTIEELQMWAANLLESMGCPDGTA